MSTADRSALPADSLLDEYLTSLRLHASKTAESALGHAYDLGRAALSRRESLLDIVAMHHAALDQALASDASPEDRRRTLRAAGELLSELLSPFDMAQSAFLETTAALRSANDLLEHEARRVARLLHDSAGQIVFALQLAIADLERDLPQNLRPRVGGLSELLVQLDGQLRCHAHELYPVMLEDLGLVAALQDLAGNTARRADLAITFNGTLPGRLPRDVESCVYRGVQEALSNVIRHARATEVTVTLEQTGTWLVCSIIDNGVGFKPHSAGQRGPGLGLVGIRERMKSINGSVQVTSERGQGTHVMLGVHLRKEEGTNGIERNSRGGPHPGAPGRPKPARS